MVSGGAGTIDTMLSALNRERPCVVLADSGGCATDLYKYYTKGDEGLPSYSAEMREGQPVNKK